MKELFFLFLGLQTTQIRPNILYPVNNFLVINVLVENAHDSNSWVLHIILVAVERKRANMQEPRASSF